MGVIQFLALVAVGWLLYLSGKSDGERKERQNLARFKREIREFQERTIEQAIKLYGKSNERPVPDYEGAVIFLSTVFGKKEPLTKKQKEYARTLKPTSVKPPTVH